MIHGGLGSRPRWRGERPKTNIDHPAMSAVDPGILLAHMTLATPMDIRVCPRTKIPNHRDFLKVLTPDPTAQITVTN